MIAHAGATLATLAVMPLVKPRQPSSCQMSRRAEKTLYLFVVIRVGVFALKLLLLRRKHSRCVKNRCFTDLFCF